MLFLVSYLNFKIAAIPTKLFYLDSLAAGLTADPI